MKGNDLATLDVHGEPYPLLVFLLLHDAMHFIGFHLKPLNHHILRTTHGPHVKMIWQIVNALNEKAQ